jgi:RNA polymerase sigma-32 factor
MNKVLTLDDYHFYLQEIEKYPMISDEEEKETALDFFHNKTMESAHKLIVSNLRYVVKIANSYKSYGFPIMDLIQEGNVGLMQAVKKFDPYKGVKLVVYASHWIRAYISTYIMNCWNIVKVNTTSNVRSLFFNTGKESHIGKYTTKEIEDVKNRKQRDVYLYDSVDIDPESYLIDQIPSEEPTPDILFELKEADEILSDRISSAIQTLNEREQYILYHRILTDDIKTRAELGEELNISPQRVEQLESNIKKKLKPLLMLHSIT